MAQKSAKIQQSVEIQSESVLYKIDLLDNYAEIDKKLQIFLSEGSSAAVQLCGTPTKAKKPIRRVLLLSRTSSSDIKKVRENPSPF